MKTLAVSFGDGRYLKPARAAITRFSRLNDVEGMVIDIEKLPNGLDHPAWSKAFVWNVVPADVERVIWIDADIVPIGPIMDIVPDFEIPFCVAKDTDRSRQTAEWGDPAVKELRTYFNSGVFVAHRSTEPLFAEWQAQATAGLRHPFMDQTPLNLLIEKHLTSGQIFELPPECNWLTPFGPIAPGVRMAHLAGWPPEIRMDVLRLFALIEDEPVQGDRIERGVACVDHWQ